ncbi:hypothetical protein D3C76_1469560 [compost metagenome]
MLQIPFYRRGHWRRAHRRRDIDQFLERYRKVGKGINRRPGYLALDGYVQSGFSLYRKSFLEFPKVGRCKPTLFPALEWAIRISCIILQCRDANGLPFRHAPGRQHPPEYNTLIDIDRIIDDRRIWTRVMSPDDTFA